MIVNSTTTAAAGSVEKPPVTRDSMNYDSFLKLLIATMKNQDPTQPNDPAQTLSQLASFSVVEQGIKTNEQLDTLTSVTTGSQAATLIGKKLSTEDGSITGIVESVEITGSGLIAKIESGARIPIIPGVTVSAA